MNAEARVAADLASLLPMTHPLAQVARMALDSHVRAMKGHTMNEEDTFQVGTKIRDAAVDPLPGDFMPMRHPAGHPDVLMHAEVDTPEFQDAVDARRAAEDDDQPADGGE